MQDLIDRQGLPPTAFVSNASLKNLAFQTASPLEELGDGF
ncbi:Hypothetical protein Minf_2407 [Methylacidiphilum infernorum V4]|uniref:Uncharacterized protein n=1 Tax=Methylacidiphilum infernorum (isolate V4) TaxID=481448 RepID=B3E0Y4_METI4|nr:Hypothetical protein Minf_2407 [Methylacidiphilum infernorum V4]